MAEAEELVPYLQDCCSPTTNCFLLVQSFLCTVMDFLDFFSFLIYIYFFPLVFEFLSFCEYIYYTSIVKLLGILVKKLYDDELTACLIKSKLSNNIF